MKKFEVIEVPASGKKNWFKGAWCLVWVYSNEGNFLLKGFRGECKEYIKERQWKCWAIFNLYHTKKDTLLSSRGDSFRTLYETFNVRFDIHKPDYKSRRNKRSMDYKFRIYETGNYKNSFYVKRLPTQFVNFMPPKMDANLMGTLGDNPALKGLKDKLDKKNM